MKYEDTATSASYIFISHTYGPIDEEFLQNASLHVLTDIMYENISCLRHLTLQAELRLKKQEVLNDRLKFEIKSHRNSCCAETRQLVNQIYDVMKNIRII